MRFILSFILISISLIILKKLLKCGIENTVKKMINKIIDLKKKIISREFIYFILSSWFLYSSPYFADKIINFHDPYTESLGDYLINYFFKFFIDAILAFSDLSINFFKRNFLPDLEILEYLLGFCMLLFPFILVLILLSRLWWYKKNLYSAYPLVLFGSFTYPPILIYPKFDLSIPIFVTMIFITLWAAFYWSK